MTRDRLRLRIALVGALAVSPAGAADAGATRAAAPAPVASGAAAPAQTAGNAPAGEEPEEGAPHARARGPANGHAAGDMFQPPEDVTTEDPSLPTGTLEIQVVDPLNKPLPKAAVTLGILFNSVAKGESRKRVSLSANEAGVARADDLESGSTVAYRPMVITDGATFSAMPFRMPEKGGMRVLLHVYPVTSDVEEALVVSQSVVYAEIKDDRVQIQQAFKVYNFGKTAWVPPSDLVVALPEAFTAFTSQQGMTDIGVDAVPKKGVRIHGTFVPGQHVLEFRWQLPYSGEREVAFEVGMLPRMAASRVMAPASKDMKLEVAGFPPPQATTDGAGQRSLITERQLRKDEAAVRSISIVISGLATEGISKIVATGLAALVLVLGIVLGSKKAGSGVDLEAQRKRLLGELADLERAHTSGDVGPKTYEKERRRVLDALAQTFAAEAAVTPRIAPRRRAT